ncbi:hypothetical protein TNCV_3047181 [Trichonephila clavipes]|nr:hypothetical protein TNCV_3047181 [Trichonephila clavipes]
MKSYALFAIFIVLDTKFYPFITVASFANEDNTSLSKTLPVSAPITVHTPINDECPLVFQVPSPLTVKGEIENETWDADSFFEISPERNEINQNTENGVLSNFDINNASVENENDNSIPLQTTSSLQPGRIQLPVLELKDV